MLVNYGGGMGENAPPSAIFVEDAPVNRKLERLDDAKKILNDLYFPTFFEHFLSRYPLE